MSPRQNCHCSSPKGGTFRQTYGFVLLGWALAYNPSHLINLDTATARICLGAHTQLVWQKEPHLTDSCLNHSSQHTPSAARLLESTSKYIVRERNYAKDSETHIFNATLEKHVPTPGSDVMVTSGYNRSYVPVNLMMIKLNEWIRVQAFHWLISCLKENN